MVLAVRLLSDCARDTMPPYVSQWAPTRELQNAKFEGYKLDFNEEDDDIRTRIKFPPNAALVGRALRPLVEARLGYKEARSRAKWNHLALGDDGSACWVDSDGVVWMIDMSEVRERQRGEIRKGSRHRLKR